MIAGIVEFDPDYPDAITTTPAWRKATSVWYEMIRTWRMTGRWWEYPKVLRLIAKHLGEEVYAELPVPLPSLLDILTCSEGLSGWIINVESTHDLAFLKELRGLLYRPTIQVVTRVDDNTRLYHLAAQIEYAWEAQATYLLDLAQPPTVTTRQLVYEMLNTMTFDQLAMPPPYLRQYVSGDGWRCRRPFLITFRPDGLIRGCPYRDDPPAFGPITDILYELAGRTETCSGCWSLDCYKLNLQCSRRALLPSHLRGHKRWLPEHHRGGNDEQYRRHRYRR